MKSPFFVSCLSATLFSATVCAAAGPSAMQARVLAKLPGAVEDLHVKLDCLRGKSYPEDIEKCGLSGFADAAHQKRLEKCLFSRSGKLVPLSMAPNGQYLTAMLVVPCPGMRVSAQFELTAGAYSLAYFGELLD